jgi:hypothetical protein
MSELKGQEPPGGRGPTSRWRYGHIAEELRARPEAWALIRDDAKTASAGTYIKKVLGEGFEVVTRRNSGAGFDVYARFVGTDPR